MDIAKYNSSLNTIWGISGGGLGVTHLSMGKQPNGWTDWRQIRYTSVDASGNGHRLKTIRPTITHGAIGGGRLGGQQFKSLGNLVKRLDRLGTHFEHIMQVNLGMDTGWKNWPCETPGGAFWRGVKYGKCFGFLGGQHFIKRLGNATISRENKL